MRQITSSTLSNQNIATALLVHTYTADADRLLFVRVVVDQVAGNGSYSAYLTLQEAGTGSAYQIQPITTATVASGITSIAFATIALPVKNTDVVKVYVLGIAGDTTTPDIITRILEDDSLRPTNADRTLDVSTGGEAGLDWANVGTPSTTLSLSGTTVATVTTTTTATNLTNAATAGDFTATMKSSITTAVPTAAAIATAVWAVLVSTATTVGSLGKLIGDNLNATVSSRSTFDSTSNSVIVGTNNDKTGYALSTAAYLAVWSVLSSTITTASTIGKLLVDNIDAAISSRMATFSYTAPDNADILLIKAKTDNLPTAPASTTNITGGTITNLTNAPTSGDLTATMKASVTAAVPTSTAIATAIGDMLTSGLTTIGSLGKLIVDNLNATVSSRSTYAGGAVASVTAGVTVSTNNDKTGYSLSGAAYQAFWDILTSAQTTTGSVGKWIVDKIDVVLSTRLATSGYTVPPTVTAIRSEIDSNSTKLDVATSTRASQTSLSALNNLSTTDIDNRLEAFDPPTKAELDTTQAAISALITALNNLSSAQTQTAVASALSSYGAATGANVTTSQTTVTNAISALHNLSDTQAAAAIMAYVLQSSKSFKDAILDIWSVEVGDATADATDPTAITYKSPDATVRVTQNIAPLTRTHA